MLELNMIIEMLGGYWHFHSAVLTDDPGMASVVWENMVNRKIELEEEFEAFALLSFIDGECVVMHEANGAPDVLS